MCPCLSARGGHIIGACTLLIIFILSTLAPRTLWNKKKKNNNNKKNNESTHTYPAGDAHVCTNEIIVLLETRWVCCLSETTDPERRCRNDLFSRRCLHISFVIELGKTDLFIPVLMIAMIEWHFFSCNPALARACLAGTC